MTTEREQFMAWFEGAYPDIDLHDFPIDVVKDAWQAARQSQAAELAAVKAKVVELETALNQATNGRYAQWEIDRAKIMAKDILANTDTDAIQKLKRQHYEECARICEDIRDDQVMSKHVNSASCHAARSIGQMCEEAIRKAAP